MEFNEKLQKLRQSKGITQEELAAELFVSRTAVSKWELGRGYPGIDSLKAISKYFEVSIDDLLSGEKILFIAERENKENMRTLGAFLFGFVDLFSFLFAVLPLYPNLIDGVVYSVSLANYAQVSLLNLIVYRILFLLLFAGGAVKLLSTKSKSEGLKNGITVFSVVVNVALVLVLALAREAYAVVLAFLFLLLKTAIILKARKI